MFHRIAIVVATSALAACGGKAPAPAGTSQSVTKPSEASTGTESPTATEVPQPGTESRPGTGSQGPAHQLPNLGAAVVDADSGVLAQHTLTSLKRPFGIVEIARVLADGRWAVFNKEGKARRSGTLSKSKLDELVAAIAAADWTLKRPTRSCKAPASGSERLTVGDRSARWHRCSSEGTQASVKKIAELVRAATGLVKMR